MSAEVIRNRAKDYEVGSLTASPEKVRDYRPEDADQ